MKLRCKDCEVWKPKKEFYPYSQKKCKVCCRILQSEKRDNRKESRYEISRGDPFPRPKK